jgi:hypothetical protein
MTQSGIEPATFKLVAQGLKQLHHRLPQNDIRLSKIMSSFGLGDLAEFLPARNLAVTSALRPKHIGTILTLFVSEMKLINENSKNVGSVIICIEKQRD